MRGPAWLGGDDAQYDVLLLAIPAVFVTSYFLAAGHVAGTAGPVVVASVASGLLILGALFIQPPAESSN